MVFITIIESLLPLYFGYVVAYTFIFSIAGLFYKVLPLTEAPTTFARFAVSIPSRIFVCMSPLLFKLKGANEFIHTPHYNVEVTIDNHNNRVRPCHNNP